VYREDTVFASSAESLGHPRPDPRNAKAPKVSPGGLLVSTAALGGEVYSQRIREYPPVKRHLRWAFLAGSPSPVVPVTCRTRKDRDLRAIGPSIGWSPPAGAGSDWHWTECCPFSVHSLLTATAEKDLCLIDARNDFSENKGQR
jgi:hypothetical protein